MSPAARSLLRSFPLWLSLGLFVLCLCNDGYTIAGPNPRAWAPAWGLLLLGWLGLFSGTVAWLANPALFAAWFLFHRGRFRRSLLLALIALALMLSFLLTRTVISNEAGNFSTVTGHGLGYWLWLASAAVLAAGAALRAIRP